MIYLDNAATSYPKPPQVIRAMAGTLDKLGANPGRSGHRLSLCAGRIIQRCREELADLFGVANPERVIFTGSCTESLNLAIGGMLHQGDEVVVSHAEHNAVMRPLRRWEKLGQITVRIMQPDATGVIQPHALQRCITPHTALVILCHASNVTGILQPAARLGAVCRENGVPFLVDAAQTAGVIDLGLDTLQADMIAMPGHKGLLGPHGTGVLLLREGIDPEPMLCGGTGSLSESADQPLLLPDRYESGTLNLPGIAGLLAGTRFVRAHLSEIREHEHHLNQRLRDHLLNTPDIRLLGHPDAPCIGLTSFIHTSLDAGEISDALDANGFAVRSGLHCAPSIHSWLGTLRSGAVRASVGIYNTEDDVDAFSLILSRILR